MVAVSHRSSSSTLGSAAVCAAAACVGEVAGEGSSDCDWESVEKFMRRDMVEVAELKWLVKMVVFG